MFGQQRAHGRILMVTIRFLFAGTVTAPSLDGIVEQIDGMFDFIVNPGGIRDTGFAGRKIDDAASMKTGIAPASFASAPYG